MNYEELISYLYYMCFLISDSVGYRRVKVCSNDTIVVLTGSKNYYLMNDHNHHHNCF